MLGTGRYNFPGIRKAGKNAIRLLLASTSWGVAVLKSPLSKLIDLASEFLTEYLANKGIIVLDIGIAIIDGKIDQVRFDNTMNDAIEKLKQPGLTDKEKDAIDEKVRQAFRDFARVSKHSADGSNSPSSGEL